MLEAEKPYTGFSPDQLVFLKSNPSAKGAVVEVLQGQAETRVRVFMDGSTKTYYASQLQAEELPDDFQHLSRDQFHGHLTALQIRHPSLSTK